MIQVQLHDWHIQGRAEDKAKDEEEKKRAFNQVTEAASELMELGYEDIYTITREAIRASAKGLVIHPIPIVEACILEWHHTSS